MDQVTKKRTVRKAVVDTRACVACGCCAKVCPRNAIAVVKGVYAAVDEALCVGCGKCKSACPAGVIVLMEAAV